MTQKLKKGRKHWKPTPEILAQVEAMAGRFLKEEQIAVLIGISTATWFEKKKHYPELSEAIKSGRAKVAANISNKLYEVAMKGNPNLLQFLAKSVVGLKENEYQVQEVSQNINIFARLQETPTDQLISLVRQSLDQHNSVGVIEGLVSNEDHGRPPN